MRIITAVRALLMLTLSVTITSCGSSNSTTTNDTSKPDSAAGKNAVGKVQACSLLTEADSQALLGGPVTETKGNADMALPGNLFTACSYHRFLADGSFEEIGLGLNEWPTAAEAKERFQTYKDRSEKDSGVEPQKISGLGDDAYWSGGTNPRLKVLKDNLHLSIWAKVKEDRVERTEAAAKTILAQIK